MPVSDRAPVSRHSPLFNAYPRERRLAFVHRRVNESAKTANPFRGNKAFAAIVNGQSLPVPANG
jgi:hypothetical protein